MFLHRYIQLCEIRILQMRALHCRVPTKSIQVVDWVPSTANIANLLRVGQFHSDHINKPDLCTPIPQRRVSKLLRHQNLNQGASRRVKIVKVSKHQQTQHLAHIQLVHLTWDRNSPDGVFNLSLSERYGPMISQSLPKRKKILERSWECSLFFDRRQKMKEN